MQKHNLRELEEYSDKTFLPKVLINQPGYRLILLNLRAGQKVPEHATRETVTVYAITGQITFYADGVPASLRAGEVLCIDVGVPHMIEASEDSSLLVLAAGATRSVVNDELDLREVSRPERHPLVFAKFDGLAVGESFVLINDHDPIPLNRQMEAMRPEQAEWTYILRGPGIFKIRVRRVSALHGSGAEFGAQSGVVSQIQRA